VRNKYPKLEDRRLIYEVIRRMIGHVVTDLIDTTAGRIDDLGLRTIEHVRTERKPAVGFSDDVLLLHTELKRFLHGNLYRHTKVHDMNERTREMIGVLFERYMVRPDHMPNWFETAAVAGGEEQRARTVADYIAGMTDRFAIAEHERLR